MEKVGLKIRFEVMNCINRNQLMRIKLPSAQELAERCGVSRRSVTIELKKMIEEGWIIGVRGSGTYTNPERTLGTKHLPSNRVIGILCGDSRQFFYDYNHWGFLTSPGLAMIPGLGYPAMIQLTERKPDAVYKELHARNVNGIIWSWPPDDIAPCLHRLMKDGIKVVTMLNKIKGVPCAPVDYKRCGSDIGAILREEGRKRIFWCAYDEFAIERMKTSKFHIPPEMIAANSIEFEKKMEAMIRADDLPDAIYLHGDSFYILRELFQKYGRDLYDGRCRLIAGWSIVKDFPDFCGIIRKYPYEKLADAAVELLKKHFSGAESYPDAEPIQMEIQKI